MGNQISHCGPKCKILCVLRRAVCGHSIQCHHFKKAKYVQRSCGGTRSCYYPPHFDWFLDPYKIWREDCLEWIYCGYHINFPNSLYTEIASHCHHYSTYW